MDQLRIMLKHPFTSFTGVTWTLEQVNEYNRLQERINTFYNAGIFPEELLNGSHYMFSAFSFRS